MAIAGFCMLKKGFRMDGAQFHGKVCTAVLDAVILLAMLLPDLPDKAVWAMVGIGVVFMLYSFARYFKVYKDAFKAYAGKTNTVLR